MLDMDLDLLSPLDIKFFHDFEESDLISVFNQIKVSPTQAVHLKEFRDNLYKHRFTKESSLIWRLRLGAEVGAASILSFILVYLVYRCCGPCRCLCNQQDTPPPYIPPSQRRWSIRKFSVADVRKMGALEPV